MLGPVEELSLAELRDQLEVNLFGTLDLCRACLPLLREAQGVIVQVSRCPVGRRGSFAAYCASKFALEGASECLAAELAPQGVRVVIVEPGPFTTPIAGKGMNAAARGATGLYDAVWQEVDEFTAFIADGAEDPAIAVDAIVAAVTVPGAPLRLPVGKNNGNWLRESFAEALRDVEQAEEFLRRTPPAPGDERRHAEREHPAGDRQQHRGVGPEWVISLPPTAVPNAIPTTTAVLSQPNTSAWVPGSAESCTMP